MTALDELEETGENVEGDEFEADYETGDPDQNSFEWPDNEQEGDEPTLADNIL